VHDCMIARLSLSIVRLLDTIGSQNCSVFL
jgi:hypothetical protein